MLNHLFKMPTKPARVIILGAGGFVAAATERRIAALEIPLLALPRTELDLTSEDAGERLAGLLRPDDTLLFVAAKAPVKNSEMLIENLRMCKAVCEALARTPVNHVIYISSDAVYADSNEPLNESSCAQPSSLHGVMHLAREVMLANTWHGSLCLLRPTLIYGAGDTHNGYGPNQFYRLAVEGKSVILFGEGEEQRDHVHIEDVIEIISLVIMHGSAGVLNISTGIVQSFSDIAQMVADQFNPQTAIKTAPRKGPMPHNGYRPFDISGCRDAFPDFRFLTLEEGLKRMNGEIIAKVK